MSERSFRRFSVAEYHRLFDVGILNEKEKVVLIRGNLVQKMTQYPPHTSTVRKLNRWLQNRLPADWQACCQAPVTLNETDSEPEPDFAIVRGDEDEFDKRQPVPADFGIVVEVADSSLREDRVESQALYAESLIPEFWIVNVVDMQIEVYTQPSGPCATPAYSHRKDYPRGSSLPLVLDGKTIATLNVDDIMPR